jgi:hypothetical protein
MKPGFPVITKMQAYFEQQSVQAKEKYLAGQKIHVFGKITQKIS